MTAASDPTERPRTLDVRPENIPDDLQEYENWVVWRNIWKRDREDWAKIPFNVETGETADATDPATWTTFAKALAAHEHGEIHTDGVGFALGCSPFVGVDLDDCREPETGEIEQRALDAIRTLDTYTEVSPSETGLRALLLGELPGDKNRRGNVEMYDTDRYVTITGHTLDGRGSIRNGGTDDDALAAVYAELIAKDDPDDANDEPDESEQVAPGGVRRNGAGDSTDGDAASARAAVGDLSDDELLEIARNAENSEKFTALWNGDDGSYPSPSEADHALFRLLAFWTGGDVQRMERLARQSKRERGKWDEKRGGSTWLANDLREAAREQAEFFDPDANARDAPPENAETLSREYIEHLAAVGDDETIASKNDREKAYWVGTALAASDAEHIIATDDGALYAYESGVWKPIGEQRAREIAQRALGPAYGANVLKELKEFLLATATVPREQLGVPTGTLAVENGLLNLDAAADGAGDDALRELRPDDYALTCLPVAYDPDADADDWHAHVEEWAEDGRAAALQEYVGYCLHVGEMPIHRALLLVGSGANGKGTFLAVVRSVLGEENTTSIGLQTLANEHDAVADFYGALANIDNDLSSRSLDSGLGMFKKLTAGDMVRGRHLYKRSFEFPAVGKHLYAANEVPEVTVPDGDEAFWRRWLLVEFPNHYPVGERDTTLKDRLAEPDALSGVLNWALAGRRRLLGQGHFTNEEQDAHQKRERWQAWGDSVETFISRCVERDENAPKISTTDAHRRYAAWCRANDEDPIGQQQFTTKLKQKNVGYVTSLRIDGSAPQRGYKFLGFSDDVPSIDVLTLTDECDSEPPAERDGL